MSEPHEEMKIDPSRAQTLITQLRSVQDRIASVAPGRNVRAVPHLSKPSPTPLQ